MSVQEYLIPRPHWFYWHIDQSLCLYCPVCDDKAWTVPGVDVADDGWVQHELQCQSCTRWLRLKLAGWQPVSLKLRYAYRGGRLFGRRGQPSPFSVGTLDHELWEAGRLGREPKVT